MIHGLFFAHGTGRASTRVLIAAAIVLAALAPARAFAVTVTPIDLNDFFFFPGDPVTIAADGSTATIGEDPVFSPILLVNDPGLGDPNVILPAADTFLVFEYAFAESPGDDDSFVAQMLDGTTGTPITGFDFQTGTPGAASVEFPLESLVGTLLGLQFSLGTNPGDAALGATVTISNLRLELRPPVVRVPEPAALVLALLAAPVLARMRRRGAG